MNTIWKNITDYLIEFPWMNLLTAIGIFLIFLVFRKLFTKYLFKVILATAKKTNVPLLTQLLLSFERPLRVFYRDRHLRCFKNMGH